MLKDIYDPLNVIIFTNTTKSKNKNNKAKTYDESKNNPHKNKEKCTNKAQ